MTRGICSIGSIGTIVTVQLAVSQAGLSSIGQCRYNSIILRCKWRRVYPIERSMGGAQGRSGCCNNNSVALVRERTIPTERPLPVGEVSANFCGWLPCGHRGGSPTAVISADPLRPYSRFSRPEPLLFLPSSSSVVLTRLSGCRYRPTTYQKIW
jgi:hypothetical protein